MRCIDMRMPGTYLCEIGKFLMEMLAGLSPLHLRHIVTSQLHIHSLDTLEMLTHFSEIVVLSITCTKRRGTTSIHSETSDFSNS